MAEQSFWKCSCGAVNDERDATCEVCALDKPSGDSTSATPSTTSKCACLGRDPGCASCCSTCVAIRRTLSKPVEYLVAAHCSRCGTHSAGTNVFHDDGAAADRGRRLCPSCWIPALKRRMELDPPDDVAECLAKIRALTSRYPSTRTSSEQPRAIERHEL